MVREPDRAGIPQTHAVTTGPPLVARARPQPQEVEGNFGPARAERSLRAPSRLAVRSPSFPLRSSPSFPLPPPLSPPPPPRRLEAGRSGRGRAVETTAPRSRRGSRRRAPREKRPKQARRTELPARRGGHEVGLARSSEQGRGGAGSRPHLEPARCAMELGGAGAPPPQLLPPLLLLLGAALLPGKFRGARRPVQGGLGPPEQGRLLAVVPRRGCAQRGSRGGYPHPTPLQTQKAALRRGLSQAGFGWVRGNAVSRAGPRSSNLDGERRGPSPPPPPPVIHCAKFPCRLHGACPPPPCTGV